jgi:penicillin-binding protein 1A
MPRTSPSSVVPSLGSSVGSRALRLFSRLVGRLLGIFVAMGVGTVAITACLTVIGGGLGKIGSSIEIAAPKRPPFRELKERSVVFDRNGRQISVFKSEENRRAITLDKVPKQLINAILDVEDSSFYLHKGVNAKSTARAMLQNLNSGSVEQGGSTITQQLVKIDLLTRAQKFDRKVLEARFALQLEKELTKNEILERYLNSVYFGGGSYGVEAAANHYFGTSVSQLDVPQSAFIAGMIRNPTGYDPVRFRERSRLRRSTVLGRMVKVGHLTQTEADEFENAPMPFPEKEVVTQERSSYFVEQVKQELLNDARLGDTEAERYQAVFNGGLRVFTTFDPELQTAAETVVADNIPEKSKDEFTASLVSVDVATGAIRAMVAGRGFEKDQFNLVTQARRQPGSSWKPFTLVAALEEGSGPDSIISGIEPCPIPNPEGDPNPYLPSNYEGSSGSVAPFTDQLVKSSNCAFARMSYVIGTEKVIDLAKRLGITTKLDNVPAISLGAVEVRPIDMVAAYATIAREGQYIKPYFVERIEDSQGNVLWKAEQEGKRAISKDVARAATQAMREVVRRGTGTKAALGGDRQVAGKTGTTQNNEDAWFVGFTAQIATAVWMGSPTGKTPMRNVGGIAVTGGTYPAEIWHDYMKIATDGQPVVDFADPDKDKLGNTQCLQVVKPKNAKSYSSKDAAKREKARQEEARKKSRQALGAELSAEPSSGGRFSVMGFLSKSKSKSKKTESESESSSNSTDGTKKRTKKRLSGNCESWGGSGVSDESSSKSSKPKSKSSNDAQPKRKKKSKPVDTTDNTNGESDPAIIGEKQPKRKKPKATPTAEPQPAPQSEPVPVPDPVPQPVPVEPPPEPVAP